jgi:hypothetical protein
MSLAWRHQVPPAAIVRPPGQREPDGLTRVPNRYLSASTSLRPIFAEYFPRYNLAELKARLTWMEQHVATGLVPWNIRALGVVDNDRWLNWYIRQDVARKKALLGEVLLKSGFAPDVVEAMSAVDRHRFCPEKYVDLAYINWSIPLFKGSALSSPTVVAYYCEDAVDLPSDGMIVEVGVGSGYHVAVMSKLLPNRHFIGFEPISGLADIARTRLAADSVDAQVVGTVYAANDLQAIVGLDRVAYMYRTYASPSMLDRSEELQFLAPRARQTFVRPITCTEFHLEPADEPLLRRFADYAAYRRTGWRSWSAVASHEWDGIRSREIRTLYGVSFVPEVASVVDNVEPGTNSEADSLIALYA